MNCLLFLWCNLTESLLEKGGTIHMNFKDSADLKTRLREIKQVELHAIYHNFAGKIKNQSLLREAIVLTVITLLLVFSAL